MSNLTQPHGGKLIDLMLSEERSEAERRASTHYPSWPLTQRQLCDLELLMNGAFSPLTGFMGRANYDSVLDTLCLDDGTVWPIPITLDVTETLAESLKPGASLALRDPEGVMLAVLEISDIWRPDLKHEAEAVYGTSDPRHPGVSWLLSHAHPVRLGGRVRGIEAPAHYDFKNLRYTPRQLRAAFDRLGWRRIAAFHTRSPMLRVHQELAQQAIAQAEANLLIHPAVGGNPMPGEIDHYTRVRCYEHALATYPEQTTLLSLLPLTTRLAGPREALWHAIIRQNFGCSHFIVGADHASPTGGEDVPAFYNEHAARELVQAHADRLEIAVLPVKPMQYVPERASYLPEDSIAGDETVSTFSENAFRRCLREGSPIPEWYALPEVIAELQRTYPPRHQQGFTVFFTGLSGAGKSTIAKALRAKLLELGGRPVTLLDGDIVRSNLSSELGFSKADRDINILRIGFVASEITKNRGVAICAPIAPYTETRRRVREVIEAVGGMVEVYVSTPLEICEQRDRKGLYAKARAGIIKDFTGIDDPYEAPENPEISIDTRDCSADQAAQRIILKLEALGYIR